MQENSLVPPEFARSQEAKSDNLPNHRLSWETVCGTDGLGAVNSCNVAFAAFPMPEVFEKHGVSHATVREKSLRRWQTEARGKEAASGRVFLQNQPLRALFHPAYPVGGYKKPALKKG